MSSAITLPRPANSELFPTVAPSLALAEPLRVLHATRWRLGRLRGGARCGELITQGERPVGALCVLLDGAGHGRSALVVRWNDLQPAETIPSIRQAAADVRTHEARLASPAPAARRRRG